MNAKPPSELPYVDGQWETESVRAWGGILKGTIWWACSLPGIDDTDQARLTIEGLALGMPLRSEEISLIDVASWFAEEFDRPYRLLPPMPRALQDLIDKHRDEVTDPQLGELVKFGGQV